MLKGYLLLVVSALCLGVANFIYPRASRVLGGANATFFYYLCAVVVALLYWLPAREVRETRLADWQWPLGLALAMFVSNLSYSYGVRYFDTALPSVIRALSFFATTLLVLFCSREPSLSGKDWLALLLVAAGIILFGYGRPPLK
ncbi:MAG: DMT family transporter [Desulfobulbaceae bacterium]|nr:DMT family transporter [Desulfobulbaceae bacterium]